MEEGGEMQQSTTAQMSGWEVSHSALHDNDGECGRRFGREATCTNTNWELDRSLEDEEEECNRWTVN